MASDVGGTLQLLTMPADILQTAQFIGDATNVVRDYFAEGVVTLNRCIVDSSDLQAADKLAAGQGLQAVLAESLVKLELSLEAFEQHCTADLLVPTLSQQVQQPMEIDVAESVSRRNLGFASQPVVDLMNRLKQEQNEIASLRKEIAEVDATLSKCNAIEASCIVDISQRQTAQGSMEAIVGAANELGDLLTVAKGLRKVKAPTGAANVPARTLGSGPGSFEAQILQQIEHEAKSCDAKQLLKLLSCP